MLLNCLKINPSVISESTALNSCGHPELCMNSSQVLVQADSKHITSDSKHPKPLFKTVQNQFKTNAIQSNSGRRISRLACLPADRH